MSEEATFPWVVALRIPQVPSVAKLKIEQRAVVGRVDKEAGYYPDMDLTPWGAAELGVAVQHIAIFTEEDRLMVEDLGSGRPTLLNGQPLPAAAPHPLEHGDELHLGNLHFQVQIIASPSYGSAIHAQPGVTIAEEATPGDGQTILIVEDDPETVQIFKLMLERAGYTIHICREVVSAIRALHSESPSAVILDLMLPDIHGLELCRYVRRDIEQRDVPIIVVSAAVTQASIAQTMDVGADVFLGKPVSMKDLVRVVSSLVDWYEAKKPSRRTKQLSEKEALLSVPEESRQDALVLFVSGHQEPIAVVVPHRVTIGRRSGTAPLPHIDLEQYGAFDAGVSRLHAAIHREDDGFYIEDLGSSNGTWVDEMQVQPETRRKLRNACRLRLGNLRLRAFFFTQDDLSDIQPPDSPAPETA